MPRKINCSMLSFEASVNGKSPYEVLGIPADASWETIGAAFRQKARQCHPDTVASLAPEFQALAEERMKELSAAYNRLKQQYGAHVQATDNLDKERSHEQDSRVPETATACFELAHSFLDQRRYQEAIVLLSRVIQLQPDFALAHLGLSVAYQALRRHAEEIAALEQAIRLQPDLAWAHAFLGVAYLHRGDTAAAEDVYRKLLPLDHRLAEQLLRRIHSFALPSLPASPPSSRAPRRSALWSGFVPAVLLVLSLAVFLFRHYDQSVAERSLPMESFVSTPEARPGVLEAIAQQYVLSLISYAEVDGGIDNERLIEEAKRRIDALLLPSDGEPEQRAQIQEQNERGLQNLREGRIADAILAFQNAVRLASGHAESLNNLGYAYFLQGNLAAAQQLLLRTLALAPARTSAWINLGQTYAQQRRTSAAMACFANAYRFSDDRHKTRRLLQEIADKEESSRVQAAAAQVLRLRFLQY